MSKTKLEPREVEKAEIIHLISEYVPEQYIKLLGQIEHLTLADFYYPGSYQSYLADTPLNGTPTEEALTKSLTYYKVRIVTLDIYSMD